MRKLLRALAGDVTVPLQNRNEAQYWHGNDPMHLSHLWCEVAKLATHATTPKVVYERDYRPSDVNEGSDCEGQGVGDDMHDVTGEEDSE